MDRMTALARESKPVRHCIEINLRDINQLFNTMDPSPFVEKDLDADAEEFIINWAQEFPVRDPLCLKIHISGQDSSGIANSVVKQAVHHYFTYRANLSRMEFRRLMREGRLSLIIGLVFLSVCLSVSSVLGQVSLRTVTQVLSEGLIILGWVAMWRPLQIYLYDWWPLRRRSNIYKKLGRMDVEIDRRVPDIEQG
jgi:hypothetical protein